VLKTRTKRENHAREARQFVHSVEFAFKSTVFCVPETFSCDGSALKRG
jgi:hypothetical protein